MIVYGTAEVSFVAGAGATILQTELKAKGQYAKIWIETDPEDPTNVHLLGDTKV